MRTILPTGQLTVLDISISGDADRREIVLHGELDICTADWLRSALDECAAVGTRLAVVDLAALDFLGAAGLTAFLDAQEVLKACGGRLVLTRPTPSALRILRITTLDTVLDVELDQPLFGHTPANAIRLTKATRTSTPPVIALQATTIPNVCRRGGHGGYTKTVEAN